MTGEKELRREYPLHWAVFRNDYENLMELLEEENTDEILDKLDVRGQEPIRSDIVQPSLIHSGFEFKNYKGINETVF